MATSTEQAEVERLRSLFPPTYTIQAAMAPEGWTIFVRDEQGAPYYAERHKVRWLWNRRTREWDTLTAWERPTAAFVRATDEQRWQNWRAAALAELEELFPE
jgi:hypothetical protein